MIAGISNSSRPYAWGSTTAIADLLGRHPSGEPEAELWLGTHPGSPALVAGGGALSELTTLPFLLKVLAADSPLSLQAHPTLRQAAQGFERENAAGIPIDAPHRNYKDYLHKPELIVAVSDTFDALCGFRPLEEAVSLIVALRRHDGLVSPLDDLLAHMSTIRSAFEWLIRGGAHVDSVVERVAQLAALPLKPTNAAAAAAFRTVGILAKEYPGDPGIVISLLLNMVTLNRGEALYLPAGNIHAYLRGLGIELMAASDNVLRGGLTSKHVDVPELLTVLDFKPVTEPRLAQEMIAEGVVKFDPGIPDFLLVHITRPTQFTLPGDAVLVVTSGLISVSGSQSEAVFGKGDAAYVSADEGVLSFTGEAELYLATTRLSAPRALSDTNPAG
ncbi:mannose-6-phosphate isomerase, class I [Diaminobutyricimonas sp. TR449]|uniref:mannose-6-phosphate isomerase, class I n=1 Tax=Diaminobutyricimonas sp. TR449 TaxID=2708076 RepID=UPI0014233833|nr:mannose-6-phosphate isomerase, class I [Diaminobutyricimonas sp. TR449]